MRIVEIRFSNHAKSKKKVFESQQFLWVDSVTPNTLFFKGGPIYYQSDCNNCFYCLVVERRPPDRRAPGSNPGAAIGLLGVSLSKILYRHCLVLVHPCEPGRRWWPTPCISAIHWAHKRTRELCLYEYGGCLWFSVSKIHSGALSASTHREGINYVLRASVPTNAK